MRVSWATICAGEERGDMPASKASARTVKRALSMNAPCVAMAAAIVNEGLPPVELGAQYLADVRGRVESVPEGGERISDVERREVVARHSISSQKGMDHCGSMRHLRRTHAERSRIPHRSGHRGRPRRRR